MRVIHAANELEHAGRKHCLAIGFFDGVHLGHQQIIRQTVVDARQHEALATVVTFDTHPNAVVSPDRMPPLIHSLSRKLRRIESLGVDALLLIHFDEIFSRLTGEQFVRNLAAGFGQIRSICVGANFAFGHRRSGDVALLRRLGSEMGFSVHGLSAVSLDGQAVSSTRIREAVLSGDFDAASQMLGRAYSLAGTIVRGDGLGRQLGFPTANLNTSGLALPPNGVYAVQAKVPGGTLYRAVLNIGCRPTLQRLDPQRRVEAHLLDFDADLYGQELEILFVDRLRGEQKFGSLRDLRDQIAHDILQAQLRF
jgi:riboflavin kinase/FMN adenylyltransferase